VINIIRQCLDKIWGKNTILPKKYQIVKGAKMVFLHLDKTVDPIAYLKLGKLFQYQERFFLAHQNGV